MSEVRMAHPELRHPFSKSNIDANKGARVLYNEQRIDVAHVLDEPGLWVRAEDLTRINGFVVKPEGACFEALCIPLNNDSNLMKLVSGEEWVNVRAFADLLEQPYAVDKETNTWSFGEVPIKRQAMMTDAQAPNFELLDRQGNVVRMADYKGKKALIVTWSSW